MKLVSKGKEFNMSRKVSLCVVLGVCIVSAISLAEVKLPAIFGDHMVLQQKANVPVWGWAEPGEKVSIKGDWQWFGKSTKADENGYWQVKIKTPKTGKTVTLTVQGPDNEIVVNDILLGEVWVCSGQSNMEFTPAMLGDEKNRQAVAQSANPQIRLFTVKNKFSLEPEADCTGSWQLCEPDVVKDFSAVGYYFGKKLNDELGVPVGLISSNWGGTVAEAWTSKETLTQFDTYMEQLAQVSDPDSTAAKQALKEWEDTVAAMGPGIKETWFSPDFDDSDWKEMQLPAKWTGTDLESVDGIVWFRRITNLPPSWARNEMEIHLGPIDDIATLWVNGVNMGTTFGYSTPRVYKVPASVLRVGPNCLAVRVLDTGYEGGFTGAVEDMRIGPPGAPAERSATLAKPWKYKIASTEMPPSDPTSRFVVNQNTPTVLYNGMITPLIPFRIAGAIWYQGESNCYDPILYRTLFPAMIEDWRDKWDQGDFPFYYVQIAPYEYGPATASQALREAQMMTLDAVDNVGMAVTMDIGTMNDIHPKNKVDVGDRLARWALTKTYKQKDIVYSGPVYKNMKVEGDKIRVTFDYDDGGLVAKDGGLTDFEIAGDDQKFVPAEAVIDGHAVVVSSSDVKEPVAVRYGWSNWVQGSLFNEAGLPASSFRTDDWPLQ